mmetsp:Transcript_66261/g.155234  ORF Transcript_66261/g.155234 Transcript_66261/m.155234 type:complete len:286 (+) Transcript_66261:233-1090(+)
MRCQVGGIRLQNHSIQWTVLRDALCSLAAPDHTTYTEDAVGEDLQRFFQEFCSSLKGMDVNLVLPRQGRFQDVHCVVVSITSMDDYRKIEIRPHADLACKNVQHLLPFGRYQRLVVVLPIVQSALAHRHHSSATCLDFCPQPLFGFIREVSVVMRMASNCAVHRVETQLLCDVDDKFCVFNDIKFAAICNQGPQHGLVASGGSSLELGEVRLHMLRRKHSSRLELLFSVGKMAVLVIPALVGDPILADFLFRAPLSAAVESVVQQNIQMAMGIAIRKVTQFLQVL